MATNRDVLGIGVGQSKVVEGFVVTRYGQRGPWSLFGRGATLSFSQAWELVSFLNAAAEVSKG